MQLILSTKGKDLKDDQGFDLDTFKSLLNDKLLRNLKYKSGKNGLTSKENDKMEEMLAKITSKMVVYDPLERPVIKLKLDDEK